MAGNDRVGGGTEVTLDDVEIGAAYPAGGDLDHHLVGGRFGIGNRDEFERVCGYRGRSGE